MIIFIVIQLLLELNIVSARVNGLSQRPPRNSRKHGDQINSVLMAGVRKGVQLRWGSKDGNDRTSSQPKAAGTPENITVQVIDSKTVEVFWSTAWKNVERYDISYNPTENRVVSQAAGDSKSIILRELRPNTQYQVTVTAVVGGKNFKSRRLVFRTSADPDDSLNLEDIKPVPTKPAKTRKSYPITPEIVNPDPTAIGSKYTPQTSTTVRGVEIGLVLLALVVWIIAIALFFHRWGKIRMLLPYQPDYKTQQSLKVPGTGTTIVSGCTGNSSSAGQQEGPGCVQHLRWSTRLFEDPSTAKKCSLSKKSLRSRVSSAIFPSSPSLCYVRTSTECDSPRIIRHAHSRSEFPMESIPLCQVNQPRSKSPDNILSFSVPVIASNVNEKALNKRSGELKVSEQKKNIHEDAIMKFEESEYCKKGNNFLTSAVDDDGDENADDDDDEDEGVPRKEPSGCYYSRNFYRGIQSSDGRERTERQNGRDSPPELEPLFFIETTNTLFHESPAQEASTSPETEKPRRYNRSSLKKQKNRFYDDRDLNVPIYESEFNQMPQEADSEKNKKPKDLKAEEMRRKAFLRKVSLQDTYLNYNQDYWLGFKKSGRFHRSIDLGYFGSEEKGGSKAEDQGVKKAPNIQGPTSVWEEQFAHPVAPSNRIQPLALKNQSKLPSTFEGALKKSDSDPVIFPSRCSCENCQLSDLEKGTNELIVEISKREEREGGSNKSSWFFLPSNDNIPLFSERNGLIETDFDVLNDLLDKECLFVDARRTLPKNSDDIKQVFCSGRTTGSSESLSRGKDLDSPTDFSNFYEIELTRDGDSGSEDQKKSAHFQGIDFTFETFPSASVEDAFFKETDHPGATESASVDLPFPTRSSFGPPESSNY